MTSSQKESKFKGANFSKITTLNEMIFSKMKLGPFWRSDFNENYISAFQKFNKKDLNSKARSGILKFTKNQSLASANLVKFQF